MFVSDSGEQMLITTSQLEFYLWEMGVKVPQWWKLFPPEAVLLPQPTYKETSLDAGFFVHQVIYTQFVRTVWCHTGFFSEKTTLA
jgi:hypothetical protein